MDCRIEGTFRAGFSDPLISDNKGATISSKGLAEAIKKEYSASWVKRFLDFVCGTNRVEMEQAFHDFLWGETLHDKARAFSKMHALSGDGFKDNFSLKLDSTSGGLQLKMEISTSKSFAVHDKDRTHVTSKIDLGNINLDVANELKQAIENNDCDALENACTNLADGGALQSTSYLTKDGTSPVTRFIGDLIAILVGGVPSEGGVFGERVRERQG